MPNDGRNPFYFFGTDRASAFSNGWAFGMQHAILLLGTRLIGPPDTEARRALEAILDGDELEQLFVRLMDGVYGWRELFGLPPRSVARTLAPKRPKAGR
jgi:hypothetical protein